MKKLLSGVFAAFAFIALSETIVSHTLAADGEKATEQLKQAIIRESIASYPGTCPCPYNVARNGSKCGGRSAYSRPGGYAPLCYPSDVTDAMVEKYRKQHSR